MKKRPLSIRLLALAFFLGPVGLVAELVYFYQIPIGKWQVVFSVPELWNWQTIGIVVLTPLMGYCVWTVRRWAYLALLGFTGLILANNLAVWISGQGMSGLPERLVMIAGLALIILVEVRKEFYAPYFNPRMRWWEQARRYLTERIRVMVREYGTNTPLFEAHSFDISVTGIYVVSEEKVAIGQVFSMDVLLPGDRSSYVTGEVVWIHGSTDKNPQGFGCRFTSVDRDFKAKLRHAIKELHAQLRDH